MHLNNKLDWADHIIVTTPVQEGPELPLPTEETKVLRRTRATSEVVLRLSGGIGHLLCGSLLGQWHWYSGKKRLNKLISRAGPLIGAE